MSEKRVVTREANVAPHRSQEFDWVDGEIKSLYIHDAKSKPMLPADEIASLSDLVQHGIAAQNLLDDETKHATYKNTQELEEVSERGRWARNEIVVANTGLVFKWATHYEGQGVEYLDLIQAGNLGLIRAAEKFDPSKGFTFATYAVNWIKAFISEEVHQSGRTIRIPSYQSAQLQKMRRIKLEHNVATGKDMPLNEVAEAMDRSVDEIIDLNTMEHGTISITTEVGVDDNEELVGFLVNPDEVPVEVTALDNTIERSIVKAMQSLLAVSTIDERSKEVIRMEFGIGFDSPLSQKEIRKRISASERTVKKLWDRAMEQLRAEASLFEMEKMLD